MSEDKGGSIAWYARFSQLSSRTSPENPKGYLNRSPKVNLEISEKNGKCDIWERMGLRVKEKTKKAEYPLGRNLYIERMKSKA